jgi:hypothetical protein
MGLCDKCRTGIVRVFRSSQLARLGRIGAFCLACGAAIVGLGSGGLFGPTFDAPDDVLGYGDNVMLATASGSNTSYQMYADGYTTPYVIAVDEPADRDQETLVIRWPDDDPNPFG